ncbi:MAG: PyrBI operon leader peptide [Comamonadaceae bacterium]|nr:MAG: PyrBI operon leader peptide [Comamonadaceae bacterium]
MKPRFIDPFTPNRPIDDPDRFFGRADPVNEMVDSLFQIKSGNPKHTIITGDRGVGKSSLLTQVHLTANGDNRLSDRLKIDRGVTKYNFLSIWHDVDATQSAYDLAMAILSKFESAFKKFVSSVNLEIDLAGFGKLGRDKNNPINMTQLIDEFVSRISKVDAEARKNKKDGVLIFIDELDRIRSDSMISSFFKLTSERLARENLKQIGFICAGITGAVQKLEEEHSSILRTFRDVPLPRFNKNEGQEILADGFAKANHTCNMQDLTNKSYDVTVGLPEPIHLLGSEMLSVDTDGILDSADFDNAIKKIVTDVRKNKLASLLKKAGGGKYQKIIEAVASYEKKIVPLDYIARSINQEQSQFSTNMATLLEREILFKPAIGHYAFTDPMLKEYVKANGVLALDD